MGGMAAALLIGACSQGGGATPDDGAATASAADADENEIGNNAVAGIAALENSAESAQFNTTDNGTQAR